MRPNGPAAPFGRPGDVGRNVKLRLASRIAYVDLVHEMAESLAREARFRKEEALNIGLAVREAVINAMKHGNGLDAGKMVDIEFRRNARTFRVSIGDRGPGFDGTETSDPCEGRNILRTSGRGILFMRHFVDRVAFRRRRGKGTVVVLEKRLNHGGRNGRSAATTGRRG